MALLGEGAYSAVYKVMRKSDQKVYALKRVKMPSLSEREKLNALNEVRLLASISHEHVIGYKEAFFDEKSHCLCIVTEYADGGDLFHKIVSHQKSRLYIREQDVSKEKYCIVFLFFRSGGILSACAMS
jgi:NIMA (never in mitosis gene a)-related kinase